MRAIEFGSQTEIVWERERERENQDVCPTPFCVRDFERCILFTVGSNTERSGVCEREGVCAIRICITVGRTSRLSRLLRREREREREREEEETLSWGEP
ncbi:hypothetical protein KIPB_009751 [Kipferlia bialata]|uniref:Uncharacterized protein n=1 Tax=Kipferlia bialata TaxID=797122 RepID=A0A391NPC2_9EUKA|nr:hypothetical protein KIPB_009751 [Kipferlia bialata]|eukprot:g9751.t1